MAPRRTGRADFWPRIAVKLSAVIACYRDAPAVPIMHERLVGVFNEIGAEYEIIFVNDGSPDNAREVLAELAARDPKVVVINHTRAFGSQSAFTSRHADRDRRRAWSCSTATYRTRRS